MTYLISPDMANPSKSHPHFSPVFKYPALEPSFAT